MKITDIHSCTYYTGGKLRADRGSLRGVDMEALAAELDRFYSLRDRASDLEALISRARRDMARVKAALAESKAALEGMTADQKS